MTLDDRGRLIAMRWMRSIPQHKLAECPCAGGIWIQTGFFAHELARAGCGGGLGFEVTSTRTRAFSGFKWFTGDRY